MSDLTKGEVAIKINGEEYTLKPSLNAFTQLSAGGADYSGVMVSILRNDVTVMARVIRLGLGWNDREAKAIPDMIFKSGVKSLHDPLTDFVFRLFNGGKSSQEVQEEAAEEAVDGARPLGAV